MPNFDVITFGETMIRLSPPNHGRLEAADSLDLRVGGSESNTAIALTRLGRRVSWWSRLPTNPLGRRVESAVHRWGVDTSGVIWTPKGRVGVYFVEFGSPPRPHQVLYDRAESQASHISPSDVDLQLLQDARHLHITGITAALNSNCAAALLRAASEARAEGITVSLDVNYRSKLWTYVQAKQTLAPILKHVDLLICTLGDAAHLYSIGGSPTVVARQLQQSLALKTVVVTGNPKYVAAAHGEQMLKADVVYSREVDRVGSGDAGDAGIIHGYLDGDLELGLRYGCAMAALKQTIPGDELIVSREEIEAVVHGSGSGIQR